jgi:amino acid transporter
MGFDTETGKQSANDETVHAITSHPQEGETFDIPEKPVHTDLYERQISEEEWARLGQTRRGLSPRQAQFMAIGSGIGTALFVGIGGPLSKAGPVNLLLGYLTYALLFTWPLNLCVGEMLAYLPVRGCIYELAGRYVDPAFGFALGWTYFFAGCMVLCVEYAGVAAVMGYWELNISPAVWIAVALVSCFLLNVVAVRLVDSRESGSVDSCC